MPSEEQVILSRDCEAAIVPAGTRVTLLKGERATITQALGGSYTVVVNGNMFRIDSRDADALGKSAGPAAAGAAGAPASREQLAEQVWDQLRTCYDPEIPVSIVELGLVYECEVIPLGSSGYRVDIKMTLTAPGCGMGDHLTAEVRDKLLALPGVAEVNVELVWEPAWSYDHMSEAARLELGLFY